jgi:hypothetical protein
MSPSRFAVRQSLITPTPGAEAELQSLGLARPEPPKGQTQMPKIDNAKMAERPEGVSEQQWRAKLAYEAVEAERAGGDVTRTSYEAQQAAASANEPKRRR